MREEIEKRKKIELQLSELANRDFLTKIFNRRKIEKILEIELDRVERYENNLSVIFFDINDFKYINDTFGHIMGDEVLIKIADLLSHNIRITDSIGRWGGDEFLIILPQTTLSQCENIILDFEEQINLIEFNDGLKISCSFGVADYKEGDDLDSLLKRADESMYCKKINRKKIKK
jgi:polar amino acid transport system substrate-binding protein